eukprot:m.232697 g.232697  ORF g.232697 m.232697 type:complete len:52 (-) comp19282_c0_seq5:2600-2755(-)
MSMGSKGPPVSLVVSAELSFSVCSARANVCPTYVYRPPYRYELNGNTYTHE